MGWAKIRRHRPLAGVKFMRGAALCCAAAIGCCGFTSPAQAQPPGGLCTVPPWWWMPPSCWASWWRPAGCPVPPISGSTRIASGGNTFGYGPPPCWHRRLDCDATSNGVHAASFTSPAPGAVYRSTNERPKPAPLPYGGLPTPFDEDRGNVPVSRLK